MLAGTMLAHESILNLSAACSSGHKPVLLQEVLRVVAPQAGECVVDCTVGAGGYAEAFLQATAPQGRLLGIDRDATLLARTTVRLEPFGDRVQLVHGSFAALVKFTKEFPQPAIIVADLGLSSVALDDPERGFSFQADGPLDMRMDPSNGKTAADIINGEPESAIEHILKIFGEEPHAKAIACAIAVARKEHAITRTSELVKIIDDVYRKILHAPAGRKLWLARGLHPATQTFQAIRLAVNDELGQLEQLLPQAFDWLAPGGRLAVVSFHSLEDRVVKQFCRTVTKACTCPPEQLTCTCGRRAKAIALTRKPIQPSPEEILANPRSRSAKLRAIRKV